MRVFVALDIPEAVRDSLAALRARLENVCRGARWVRIEGVHVTLKFIGEVAAEQAEHIRAALRAIRFDEPIELHFAGLGFFPDEHRPRVFWAGIESGVALAHLATAIEAALIPLGIPREQRDFRPHLTLARFKSFDGIDRLRAAVAATAAAGFGRSIAKEFYLYRSVLKPAGAEYTRLETYPFVPERVC